MALSILLYVCTIQNLTKCKEKKLGGNYTKILCAFLNKSWKQHLTKLQLCHNLPPISQTSKIWWTTHAGHCYISKNKYMSNILLWTPTHGHTSVGQLAITYIHQLCSNTGYSQEDFPGVMDTRDRWWERESRNSMLSAWLDGIYIYIYIYMCVCVCVCIIRSSLTGVGSNSIRTKKHSTVNI